MITITANGKSYNYDASLAQIAGLGAIVASVNAKVPPKADGTPGDKIYADGMALLQESIEDWVKGNPSATDQDVTDTIARALNSWAGIKEPPPEVIDTMTDEEKKARLIAYAAEKRWNVATSGVTFNGVTVPSDDTASTRIRATINDLAEGVIQEPVIFVVQDFVVPATKDMLQGLKDLITLKWQAAYKIQGELVEGVKAGAITSKDQIDQANW